MTADHRSSKKHRNSVSCSVGLTCINLLSYLKAVCASNGSLNYDLVKDGKCSVAFCGNPSLRAVDHEPACNLANRPILSALCSKQFMFQDSKLFKILNSL